MNGLEKYEHNMKNLPIFILNKDRLEALKEVVASLHKRNYTNITIIDNKSTYEPLLEWYRNSGVDVYFNPMPKTCNGSLHFLAFEYKVPKFYDAIMGGYYVFNDSDVVPVEECPTDFVEDMIEVCKKYDCHKVGLGLKIDDIPDCFYRKDDVQTIEGPYWKDVVNGEKMPLYSAPIDTTFAVYKPGSAPVWGSPDRRNQPQGWVSGPCFRTGGNYVARHLPWYYDYNNLPEDEKYYIMNLEPGKGPCWSFRAKEVVK